MKCIYKIIFLSLLLIVNTVNANEQQQTLTVNLPALSVNLTYPSPVRLSQVLSDAEATIQNRANFSTFWLAAQLLEQSNNTQVTELKNKLIEQLNQLSQIEPETKTKADLLIEFINTHRFNYRHFITLDNDLVRIQNQLDPLLKGHFILETPVRSNQIRIVGGSKINQQVDQIAHRSIEDYLKSISLPKTSQTSFFYIIQPDGVVNKASNAYWDNTATFFAPGATLFIGFDSLPAQFPSLNQQIADLLRYLPPLTVAGTI
jgi:flagellar biosynthesis regulator FlaF